MSLKDPHNKNSKTYSRREFQFSYHKDWVLIEENWDKPISSLLFEGREGEFYSVDIYHVSSEKAPSLSSYEKIHFESYINELPPSFKLIGPPIKSVEKRRCFFGEIIGSKVEFQIQSFFLLKSDYLNYAFRLDLPNCTSFISAQFLKESKIKALKEFDTLLVSFRTEKI